MSRVEYTVASPPTWWSFRVSCLWQEDVSFQGYLRHMSSCCGPAPLTAAEQELQRIKTNEVSPGDTSQDFAANGLSEPGYYNQ